MVSTKKTEISRKKHSSIYRYTVNNGVFDYSFKLVEYRYKGLKVNIKLPSKNALRKAKRYNKELPKPKFIQIGNNAIGLKASSKRKHYKKQQEHFRFKLFGDSVVFNNGYLKNLKLSSAGNDKIGLLIQNIITN